ncbi:MAG: potassium transporter TrkH [Hyphomicrobiales bacterium]|nr:MAG: potassium transporter TrkH [Hyphomicrobiales bacterium]
MTGTRESALLPVLKITAMLMIVLGALMVIPALVDLSFGNEDWRVFAGASGASLFFGTALLLSQNRPVVHLSLRQAFVMVNVAWFICSAAGALPFMLAEVNLSLTDAFFEAVSGITTTGSTVLTGLDHLPPGILLWRAILQWIGGLGIIVTGISFFPALKIGGMQMFKVEAFDIDNKDFPQAARISAGLVSVYLLLTLACAGALWLAGMTGLEAVVHAMTTLATGGFSTSDASVGHFDSAVIEAVITLGMIAGGIPFLAYVRLVLGRQGKRFFDDQVRVYLAVLAVSMLSIALWLMIMRDMSLGQSLRLSSFNVASVMTGTGYVSADYLLWGAFPMMYLLALTLVGGCAGSTSCGMKIFRFQILFRVANQQMRRLVFPSLARAVRYRHMPVDPVVMASVQSFFFLFVITLAGLTTALTVTGLDFVTAISGAATAMANVGPGLGEIIGPTGTFQSLPDSAKWLISAGMLIGRLEVLTVYVLFTRMFWLA